MQERTPPCRSPQPKLQRQAASRDAHRGFTLIELLVVVSIIVILLAVLVPSLTVALNKSDDTKCAAHLRGINQTLTGYALDSNRTYPPGVADYSRTNNPTDNSGNPLASSYVFAYAMDYRTTATVGAVAAIDAPNNPVVASARQYRRPVVSSTTFAAAGLSPFSGLLPFTLGATADPGGASGVANPPLGLGILVAAELLPGSKLGDMANCPRINTTSAAPSPRFGMDEVYNIEAGQHQTTAGPSTGAGGSFWTDPNQFTSRIIGSYNYRATSYAFTRGGTAAIKSYEASQSFVMLTDLLDVRVGRRFAHLTGYNVAYGDGHAEFWNDDAPDANGFSEVDRYLNAQPPNPIPIDGTAQNANAWATGDFFGAGAAYPRYRPDTKGAFDEVLYHHLSVQRNK